MKESRSAPRITGTISVRVPSFFSTSTARPRLTWPSSTRWGLPSISAKWWAMTGMSWPARAIAKAIRCVKETFCPASLSCLRRPSMAVTVSVRNEVAVGIERLSSMYRASIAAPPLSSVAAPSTGAGARRAAVAGGGEHVRLGDAPARAGAGNVCEVDAVGRGGADGDRRDLRAVGRRRRERKRSGGGGAVAARAPCAAAAPLVVMRASTWPTVTVSPAAARTSVIVPVAGEGTSASTLSVEISTTVSSACTASPGCLCHSRIVPSETDSPMAGMTISRVAAPLSVAGSESGSGSGGGLAAAPLPEAPFGLISASTAPTATVSPSAARIFVTVPVVGAGTSASTLSVEISTRVSSAETSSPSCLCHSRTVPSVTESPICGITTCTVVFTAIQPPTLHPVRGRAERLKSAMRAGLRVTLRRAGSNPWRDGAARPRSRCSRRRGRRLRRRR